MRTSRKRRLVTMAGRCLVGASIAAAAVGRVAPLVARQAPPSAVVFEGARLITGDGTAPLDNGAFVVDGGRFTEIGTKGRIPVPENARHVDLTGKTVMPGLVDAHVHVGYRKGATFTAANYTRETILAQLNRFGYYGVGAVLSTGTDRGDLPFELRAGPHPGALLRTAWRGLAMPDAGPNPPMRDAAFGVATETDARRDVAELAAKHVDLVKIWVDDRNGTVPKLTPALYRAIIDEAHRRGIRTIAHAVALSDVKDLMRAGIDGFAHLFRDHEADDELMGLLRERPKVFFLLTLWAPRLATYTERPEWLDDPRLREITAPEVIEDFAKPLTRSQDAARGARVEWDVLVRNVRRLDAAGVRLALGTDVGGNTGGGLFGWTEHIELENMVAAGMTPARALVAATRTAAEAVGIEQLGTLAAGKRADFLVLDANPLADIRNTRAIARVFLGGAEVDRSALRAAWRQER